MTKDKPAYGRNPTIGDRMGWSKDGEIPEYLTRELTEDDWEQASSLLWTNGWMHERRGACFWVWTVDNADRPRSGHYVDVRGLLASDDPQAYIMLSARKR